ncbi:hypothetical protein B0H11DRAFT_1914831 [Mycena galericulata]|nr:hypothetical protein B0H11DRAFT_1914831 [Mycena galericulata]
MAHRRPPSQNEPAPVDSARTTSRSTRSSSHTIAPPEQPQRAPSRSTRRNPRTTPTVQDAIQPEPGRGFAPLTARSHGYTRRTPSSGLTTSDASFNLQPTRAAPHNQPPFQPQTPGRVAANHLLSRLKTGTLMASPGPPLRNQSDDESEQDDEESENLGITPDSSPPPRPPQLNRRRGIPPVQPFPQINEAIVPQQRGRSQAGSTNDKWNGYRVDQDGFAWAEDAVLEANSKSADCQAFYGEHIEHRGFKCKLCPMKSHDSTEPPWEGSLA